MAESTNSSTWTKPSFGGIAWIQITASDVLRAKAFYTNVFNWTFRAPAEGYPEEKLAIFYTPEKRIMGGIIKTSEMEAASGTGVTNYVLVEDVEESFKKIVEAGGSVHTPKIEEGGHTILGKFLDTEGNIMGIMQWLM